MSVFKNNDSKDKAALEAILKEELETEAIETEEAQAAETEEAEEAIEATEPSEKKAKKTKKADKAKRARNLRRLRYGTTSTALTAVVIAAVVLLNVIVGIVADKFPVTLDLSSNKLFTLSDESVAIAEQIKDELEIVIFYDEAEFTNPQSGTASGIPEFDTTIKEFYNALKQYRTHSDNQVSYSFIDPNQEPAKFAAYENYEVAAGDILFLFGERYKICTLNDMYTMDTSEYYTYTFESKVEKTLASTIYSLTSGNDRVVQVLVGHGEDSGTIDGLKELYELNGYTFEEISITGSAAFNEKAEVMLIAAPENDYSDAEIKRVQEWMFNDGNYGRHLMVFTNPTADCPNLYEYLNVEHQIQVTDELLLESDLNRVQSYQPFYAMCDVPQSDLIEDAVSTGALFTPLARRLTTDLPDPSTDGTEWNYKYLLNSYPETAQLIKLADRENLSEDKVYNAADAEYPLTSMIVSVYDGYNNNTSKEAFGTVTVSGCPTMAYSTYLQTSNFTNEDLLLETVNSVTGNESVITISNKSLSAETITFSGGTALILGLVVFTVGLPLVILITCLIVFLRRKNL